MRAARERIRGRLAGWAKESSFPAAGYGWMALTRRKTGARGPAGKHAPGVCGRKRAADSPGGVTRSPVARTGRQPPADAEAESAAEVITAARAVSPGASMTRCAVAVVSAAAALPTWTPLPRYAATAG